MAVVQLPSTGFFDWPIVVGVNPTTGYIYVANTLWVHMAHWGANSVTVLSGTKVITTLGVGQQPGAVGVNPVTGYVYVANMLSNNLLVLANTRVTATLPRAWFMPIMMKR